MTQGTVLVLGGSGFTGSVLRSLLAERGHRVVAPVRADLDLERPEALRAHIVATAPDAVVNVAAAPPQASPERMHAVNVAAAEVVAAAAAACGARLVHVASDAGHDGRGSPYADDAPMNPITAYGRSKAEGESRVLAACPDAVSVRTSLLWDPAVIDRGTARFIERLEAGVPCPAFVDEIRCPLPRRELAACLADLVGLSYAGSLNVVGREPLSRHDFALLLLRHFGVPGRERVEAVRVADLEAAGAAPRPRDVRLGVERVESLLGRRMPGVRDVLAAFVSDRRA